MIYKDFQLKVDFEKSVQYTPIKFVQGDTGTCRMVFNTKQDITGLNMFVAFELPNRTNYLLEATAESSNLATLILPTGVLGIYGRVSCQVSLYGTTKRLTNSVSFYFDVARDLADGAIEASDHFPLLTRLITDCQNIVDVETLRVIAEQDRVVAENGRVSAEEDRADAENNRVIAEESREAAEILRQAHITDLNNPHAVTKAQIGLGNVDNTADINKSVLSATKLATARNIAVTGDVTGTTTFNGESNVSIATTAKDSGVSAGTYKSVTVDAKGRVTNGTNPTTLTGYGISDAVPITRTVNDKPLSADIVLTGTDIAIADIGNYYTATTVEGATQEVGASLATANGNIAVLQADVTTMQTDVTTLQTDVSTLQTDVTGIKAEINTPDQNTVTLTELEQIKSVTDSYGGIAEFEVGGATLYQAVVNGQNVPTGESRTFTSRSGIVYYDTLNNMFITGDGTVKTITNSTGLTKNIMAVSITETPYASYTADQMNAMVNEYFEGLKSAQKVDITSVGKNLFPNATEWEQGDIKTEGVNVFRTTRIRTTGYVRVKPNTLYTKSTASPYLTSIRTYDKNKNFLKSRGAVANFTTDANECYVRAIVIFNDVVNVTVEDFDLIKPMFNEGSTALPYEPYIGSNISVTCTDITKFDRSRIPNLVQNTIGFKDGKWVANKRVERYVLQASDITSISSSSTNVDYVILSNNAIQGVKNLGISDVIATKMITSVTTPRNAHSADDAMVVWRHCFNPANWIFIVPKGTYATLADAQTALAGTVVYYELATPITISEESFADCGIEVTGTLASNNDYTEFYADNFDIFSPISIDYATNIAKAVDNLKDGVISLKEFQTLQNLINLEFDARLTALEP